MRKLAIAALALCVPQAFAVSYLWDDGTANGSIGLTAGGTIAWGNQFTTVAGGTTITSVQVSWHRNAANGNMSPNGTPITVHLWSDPNNDGNPADAVSLSSLASTVMNSDLPGFVNYDIPDVVLGVGTNFFVGVAMTHAAGDFPASHDNELPHNGKSWISIGTFGAAGNTFNLNDLSGLEGDWLVRAEAVPEPATLAALGLGIAAMVRRRRKAA